MSIGALLRKLCSGLEPPDHDTSVLLGYTCGTKSVGQIRKALELKRKTLKKRMDATPAG